MSFWQVLTMVSCYAKVAECACKVVHAHVGLLKLFRSKSASPSHCQKGRASTGHS